jgi:type VI secretion system protein ImpM
MSASGSATGAVRGFYGKLPARGDFVRAGLPGGFIAPWDAWIQRVLVGSRARLGEMWLAAWMEAPVWNFLLPAGVCGPEAAAGVWLPSVDRAGRHFPLTLAMVGPDAADPDLAGRWLAVAQAAGLAGLEEGLAPEALARRLVGSRAGPVAVPVAVRGGGWWTEGSPFVPPTVRARAALPGPDEFAAMLHAADDATAWCDGADRGGDVE